MTIACLGWGSLIWCQKTLPVKGEWQKNGPHLPLEFARESRDKRITLVICNEGKNVQTLWAELDVRDVAEAKIVLADREGIPRKNISKHIGFWTATDNSSGLGASAVGFWASALEIESVVWTALPPKMADTERVPSLGEVIQHFRALKDKDREIAEEYVRLAPRQIMTPYREAIKDQLGWAPAGLI